MTRPNARLAFWLSFFVPGLGQAYAGAPLRGAALLVVSFLGFAGIVYGFDHGGRRPEYVYYGIIGAVLFAAAWWGAAWHAGHFAARAQAWPPLYRFFARPDVREKLWAARVELWMALAFALFTAASLLAAPPRWLPEAPRYWFLYELFGALYIAVFHSTAYTRITGFLAITLLASFFLARFTRLPAETIVFAYLLALPSCWHSLRHRGEEAAKLQWARFAGSWLCVFFAMIGFAIVSELLQIVYDAPEYRVPLLRNENFVVSVIGVFYYLLRAGFEMLVHYELSLRANN